MTEFLVGLLTALGLASGVARGAVPYALASAAHVFGIALLLGPILLVDLRLIGWLKGLDLVALALLRRAARIGLIITLVAGLLLLSAKPAEYLANRVVLAKLGLVALAILNALAFEWRVRREGLAAAVASGGLAGLASLSGWITVLLLGRWIAFSE
jgi:hypothetical protein